MSTSGDGALSSLGYVVLLALFVMTSRLAAARAGIKVPRARAEAIGIWLLVAVVSIVGLCSAAIYESLSRQPDAVMEHHQLWRLLTSAIVQDGGLIGTLFNLAALGLCLGFAPPLLRRGGSAILLMAAAIAFNIFATFVLNAAGAGNSAATFFLCAATVGALAVVERSPRARAAAALIAIDGLILAFDRDAHAVALLAGIVLGATANRLVLNPNVQLARGTVRQQPNSSG